MTPTVRISSPPPRVTLSVTRTTEVIGIDGKPALTLTLTDGKVTVALLPRNGSRRAPVRLEDLRSALDMLKPEP